MGSGLNPAGEGTTTPAPPATGTRSAFVSDANAAAPMAVGAQPSAAALGSLVGNRSLARLAARATPAERALLARGVLPRALARQTHPASTGPATPPNIDVHSNAAVVRLLARQSVASPTTVRFAPPDHSSTLAERLSRHAANCQLVDDTLQTLAGSSRVVDRNTAEVVRSRHRRVRILTPTHDPIDRAIAARCYSRSDPHLVYFGANQSYPDRSATYDPAPLTGHTLAENTICDYDAQNAYGSWDRQEAVLTLLDPVTQGLQVLQHAIVHEIQHSLDHMEDEPSQESNDSRHGSALSAWTHNRDEFRAYWISGQYDHLSDAPGSGLHGWGSRRQEEITYLLVHDSEQNIDPAYSDIGFHYHRNHSIPGSQPRTFQAAVRAYARPEGVNLINSIRIDRFYEALGRVMPSDVDVARPPLSVLLARAIDLDADDRAFVNSSDAWRLQNSIAQRCRNYTLDIVGQMLASPPGSAVPAWVQEAHRHPPSAWTGRAWWQDLRLERLSQ